MFPTPNGLGVLTSLLLLTCAGFSASPRNALGQASPTPTPTATATATATPTATPTPGTRLGNISTRSLVEVGDKIPIAGFIVTGTQSKKVIVRGIGPSLEFPGKLADPTLELRDSKGAILDSNDDWKGKPDGTSQEIEVEQTGLAPT